MQVYQILHIFDVSVNQGFSTPLGKVFAYKPKVVYSFEILIFRVLSTFNWQKVFEPAV